MNCISSFERTLVSRKSVTVSAPVTAAIMRAILIIVPGRGTAAGVGLTGRLSLVAGDPVG
jgi:hypothetical protein